MGKMIDEDDAIKIIHKTTMDFMDVCGDDSEECITKKKILLDMDKKICDQITDLPSAELKDSYLPTEDEWNLMMKAIPGTMTDTLQFDNVSRPKHYADGKVECIDAMEAVFGVEAVKYFCLCNAFKYHWRHGQKNGVEDIEKATWYMDKYRELMNR